MRAPAPTQPRSTWYKYLVLVPGTFATAAALLVVVAGATSCRWPSPGPRVYVSNERDGTISVIDAATDEVVDTLEVGSRPRGILVSPDNEQICVALSKPADGRAGEDTIVCLDGDSHREVGRYAAGSDPETFSLSLDGRRLYVANEDVGRATVMDLESGEAHSHWVGLEPEGVTTSPDGRWVYVTSEASSTVSVIETDTGTVVTTFMVGARPRETAFSPDGKLAFVSAENGASISVVDVSRHVVIDTITLDPVEGRTMKPKGLACSPDGKLLYVATGRGNTVAIVDVATRKVESHIAVGNRCWGIALTLDGRKLYAANGLSNDVSVIDTERRIVLATIRAGDGPWGVAIRR
jgi:PQQ-dependent catabolism-associated beta-propeller protein